MNLFSKKTRIPTPTEALPGRADPMPVAEKHFVLGTPLAPPFPDAVAPGADGTYNSMLNEATE